MSDTHLDEGKLNSFVKYWTGEHSFRRGIVVEVKEGHERDISHIDGDGNWVLKSDVPRGKNGGHYWSDWDD